MTVCEGGEWASHAVWVTPSPGFLARERWACSRKSPEAGGRGGVGGAAVSVLSLRVRDPAGTGGSGAEV